MSRNSAPLELAENEIHLWLTRDRAIRDPKLLAAYHRLLAPAESEQQRRFHFDKHRHQYLVTRALLRSVLSLYSGGVDPSVWRFGKNAHGKPFIVEPELPPPLHFNLSHTEGMIVLGISRCEIGVDVEWLERRGETVAIADRYFSPREAAQLRALEPVYQRGRFFDLWTLKEAYIKACGMGLAIPLDHFSYAFSEGGEISISFAPERKDRPECWSFWQIEPEVTYKVALALKKAHGHRLCMKETVPMRSSVDVNYPIVRQSGSTKA